MDSSYYLQDKKETRQELVLQGSPYPRKDSYVEGNDAAAAPKMKIEDSMQMQMGGFCDSEATTDAGFEREWKVKIPWTPGDIQCKFCGCNSDRYMVGLCGSRSVKIGDEQMREMEEKEGVQLEACQ